MLRDGLWAAGALTIGLGVVPTIAGLTALVKPGHEPWSREQRAFASVAGTMIVAFGFYGAVKAAFISTLGLTQLIERNIIYLAPLLFVGTAMVFEQRRARLSAIVGATAFALYVVTTTPYHMDISVFFDAPGLAVLSGLGRDAGLTSVGAKIVLIVLALGFAAALAFVRSIPRRSASRFVVIAAGFVLAWNAYGEISFARAAHKFAARNLSTVPRPLDWVDRAVPHDTQVYYIGQSIDDTGDVLQLEFWNRTVQHVRYVVADYGISPIGQIVASKIHHGGRGARQWTLVRIAPPLRVRQTIEGVYPDGWGNPNTALNQYSIRNNAPSVIRIHVSRTQAARLYPAMVRVRVGTLAIGAGRPAIGAVLLTRELHVPNHLDHTFVFEAPPAPFRVETSVTPFPHDRDPTIGDPRDLGANVDYSVTPRPS
jgi:hypothetical protein